MKSVKPSYDIAFGEENLYDVYSKAKKITDYKEKCEEGDDYLYKLDCSKGIFYCLGKPSWEDNGTIVEFVDIETEKEKIFKFSLNDTFSIEEL